MRAIISIVVLLVADSLTAASVECIFVGIDQSYETRFMETMQFSFNYDGDSPGMVLPPLGPYKIEIHTYEENFNIGVEIAKKAISSITIPLATLKRVSNGESIFGFINAHHAVKNEFMILRYGCIMNNQAG